MTASRKRTRSQEDQSSSSSSSEPPQPPSPPPFQFEGEKDQPGVPPSAPTENIQDHNHKKKRARISRHRNDDTTSKASPSLSTLPIMNCTDEDANHQMAFEVPCESKRLLREVCCHTGNVIIDPDTGHHVILQFAGQSQNSCDSRHNNLHGYVVETEQWMELPRPPFPNVQSRALHAAIVRKNKLIISGGSNADNNLQEMRLYEFDFAKRELGAEASWREIQFDQSGNHPRRRERHMALYCEVTDSIIFHGGYTLGNASKELYEFRFYTEEQRKKEKKEWEGFFTEKNSNLAAYDQAGIVLGQFIYRHGGEGSFPEVVGDFHTYDIASLDQENMWKRVRIHNLEHYPWKVLLRKGSGMVALNERFIIIFGGTPYKDVPPMMMLDLRKGELHPIRMNNVKIGIELHFFSMIYIPELKKLYISGGVYHTSEEVAVSKDMIVCDFSDPRFHEDVLHVPKAAYLKTMQSMLGFPQLSDITLKSKDGLEFPVHKIVLVSQSQYFKTFLLSEFEDSQNNVVEFEEIDGQILGMIVKYLYAQDVPLQSLVHSAAVEGNTPDNDGTENQQDRNNVSDPDQTRIFLRLVQAANFLGLDELCDRCFEYIMKSVDSSNALEMIALSKTMDGEKSRQLGELCFKKLTPQQLFEITTGFADMMFTSTNVRQLF